MFDSIDLEALDLASRKDLLEIAEITESFATERDCKFYLYEPNDIPKLFHMSDAKLRAIFGGNRSSKTYSHVEDHAIQFTGEAPDSLVGLIPEHRLDPRRRLRFCMEDYPNSFIKVVWPYFKQLVPANSISDVVKDSGRIRAITNRKGGFVEFMYYDQEVTKHQGSSRHAVGYDEEPPQSIRDEGLMRLVDTDGEETFSLTPVSGAMRYLYDDVYLKRGRETEKNYDLIMKNGKIVDAIAGEITDKVIPGGDVDTHVFFACIFDNKAISKRAAIRILSKFPKAEMIMRAKGKFMFLSGLVYKDYTDSVHLIDPFTDWFSGPQADNYTLYIAIDPHPRTPHAVLFVCVRKDGLHFIVDEIYEECNAPQLVRKIREKCRGKRPQMVLVDPLASTPDPSTKSCLLFDLIDLGLHDPMPRPASKAKDRGIIRCQKRLEYDPRIRIPGVYVSSNCTRFRFEITRYAWDDWKKDAQNTKGPKQKPVDKDDHMMENWYRIENLDPQFVSPYREDNEVEDYYQPSAQAMSGRSAVTGY